MIKVKRIFRSDLMSVILPSLVLVILLFSTAPGFISEYNITSILQNGALFLLVGFAQMSTLALGQFNLAVGSIGVLSAILMGFFMQTLGMPAFLAFILGIIAAIISGMMQGVLIAKSGINPFIITLALLSIFRGIAIVIPMGVSYNELPETVKLINACKIGTIPILFVFSLAVCAAAYIVFHFRDIGRFIQAVGANERAARFSGINVDSTIITAHTISGLFCGLAACVQVVIFNSAMLTIGTDWMMASFVITILGGTRLSGGKVSVIGTLFGCIMMMLLKNALGLWRINSYAYQAVMGVILLVSYEVDRARVALIRRRGEAKPLMEGAKDE